MILRNRLNTYWIFLVLSLSVFFVTATTTLKAGEGEKYSNPPSPDLSNHAIYSHYDFHNSEDVVNMGTQPVYSPTGLITETMKRDTVLYHALSESGSKIRFFPFLKGNDLNFFLRRGDIDVGIGGDMPTINAAATLDITISSIIQQGFTSIVARQYLLMRELKGRNIGYALGSNAHYALLRALYSDGLNETLVHLIPMDVNEMSKALRAGEIAAFSAWEPTPAITLLEYPESTIIHRFLSSGFLYFSRVFSENHPEIARQILAAEIRALKWLRSDWQNLLLASKWSMQACKDLTSQNIGLTVEQIAYLAEKDIIGLSSMPFIPRNSLRQNGPLHREFELLKDLNKIPVSVSWEKVHNSFDLRIVTDVLANAKKYRLNQFRYRIE